MLPVSYPGTTLGLLLDGEIVPKLTAQSIERLKPDPARRLEVADSILPGLYLVIQPSGARSWAVRYRHGGRTRKHTIGTLARFPLLEARAEARLALQAVAAGRDPAIEKKEARAPDRDVMRTIVEDFLERHVRANNRPLTARSTEHLLRKHVLRAWGDRKIQTVARRDVIALMDAIVDSGSPIAANRVLSAISKLFNWCIERGVIEISPCAQVRKPTAETSRDRVLSDDEVALVWRAAERLGWPFGTMTQLLLLTGQRRGEVCGMDRREIAGPLWTIPGARAKNGQTHEVPLSAAALKVLAAAPGLAGCDLILSTNGTTQISGHSKAKSDLDAAMLAIARESATRAGRNDLDEIRIEPWRIHDLRRTLASGLARLGQPCT